MQYIIIILGIFGLDSGIKNLIEKNETEGDEKEICKGALLLRKHHNKGAFLNTGQNKQMAVAVLSAALTLLATAFFVMTLGKSGKGLLKWGLTLLLGGAYSNTYDRLVRRYVVDYVSFNVPVKKLRRIIFNVSDFCIMIGAVLCVIGYSRSE